MDLSKVDEDVVQRIGTMEGVRAAEGFLTGYTSVGDLPFFVVFGYRPRGLAIREYRIVEGERLTTNRQMVLGRVAAKNLNIDVGDTIRVFDRAFRVVGIYETGVTFQDGGGVVTLRDAQRLFGQPNKVSFLGIWLEERAAAGTVIRRVEARFPEVAVSKASAFTEDVSDLQAMESMTWGISHGPRRRRAGDDEHHGYVCFRTDAGNRRASRPGLAALTGAMDDPARVGHVDPRGRSGR